MIDTNHFKELLLKERGLIESELQTVGRKNPLAKSDWEAVEPDVDRDRADEAEVADNIEQFESNSAILEKLEARYKDVSLALSKIDNGTYGTCEINGEEIELDRLEANPAATTCKTHMNS